MMRPIPIVLLLFSSVLGCSREPRREIPAEASLEIEQPTLVADALKVGANRAIPLVVNLTHVEKLPSPVYLEVTFEQPGTFSQSFLLDSQARDESSREFRRPEKSPILSPPKSGKYTFLIKLFSATTGKLLKSRSIPVTVN